MVSSKVGGESRGSWDEGVGGRGDEEDERTTAGADKEEEGEVDSAAEATEWDDVGCVERVMTVGGSES